MTDEIFSENLALTADSCLPFQLDRSLLRGRIVRLGPALDLILKQHAYPPAVAKLLAEVALMAVALSSTLKYEGVFTLQTKSDGAVRFLVADVTSEGGIRAYAGFDPARVSVEEDLLGTGYLAFTADLAASEDRYQGIVELDGAGVIEAVQRYFKKSEQIPTALMASVRRGAGGAWEGGCLLLQRLPREGGNEAALSADTSVEDDWLRAISLMQTCTDAELADPVLPLETLLYRLFHEEEVRVYEPKALRHACRCSRARVEGMLRSMPLEEVKSLAVDGKVSVTCEFCNRSYVFTEKDVEALHADLNASPEDA